jgi:hypothetical protein
MTLSAGRPAQATTTEDVQVKVRDGVARDLTDVEDEPVPVGHQALGTRDGLGGHEEVRNVVRVDGRNVVGARYMRARDHEDMRRRLRVEVPEGVAALAREHLRRRDLSPHDPTEQARVVHGTRTLPLRR